MGLSLEEESLVGRLIEVFFGHCESFGVVPLLHKSPFAGRAGPPQRRDLDLFVEQWELDISIHELVPRWCKPPWPNLIPQTLGGYLSNNLFNPGHGSLNQPQKRAQSQNCQVGWKICVWKIRLFLFKTKSLSSKMLDSLTWEKKNFHPLILNARLG